MAKTDKIEITVEVNGYELNEESFVKKREKELMLVLYTYIDIFGIPKKGQIFYDGNIGARLDSIVFSVSELTCKKLCIDFTFSIPEP